MRCVERVLPAEKVWDELDWRGGEEEIVQGGLLRPGWGVWAFILRAGLRIVAFTFLHNLAQWRWNWRGQDGRPRDQEGGYVEIRVRDGGAFMEKGFGHFESGAGYFYLYSAHIWALNHGEYRKIKWSVLRLIDLNGRLIHFNISLSDHLLYGSAALMIKFKSWPSSSWIVPPWLSNSWGWSLLGHSLLKRSPTENYLYSQMTSFM